MHVFGDAADAVAAHFAFAAIVVEHPHPRVRDIAGQDQDQPVSADTEAAMRNPLRQFSGVSGNRLVKARHVHVVVASAMHFAKSNHSDVLLSENLTGSRVDRWQRSKRRAAAHRRLNGLKGEQASRDIVVLWAASAIGLLRTDRTMATIGAAELLIVVRPIAHTAGVTNHQA